MMDYLESALDEASTRGEDDTESCRSHLLAELIMEYGLGSGALDRFGEHEVGEFDRVKWILLELARRFGSDLEVDRVWHDAALSSYDPADACGPNHTSSRVYTTEPQKMDRWAAAPCDEDTEERKDPEGPTDGPGPVASPIRWTVGQYVLVCWERHARETPKGKQVIESVIRLLRGNVGPTPPKLFKLNGKFNRSGIRQFMGPAAPDHHTIRRVLRDLRVAVQEAMRGPRTAEPRDRVKPDLIVGEKIMNTPLPLVAGATPIPDAMLDRLHEIQVVYQERLRYPHDHALQMRLGYLCTQEGRLAATEVWCIG